MQKSEKNQEFRDLALVKGCYAQLASRHCSLRGLFGRALTLAEKVVYSHLEAIPTDTSQAPQRGKTHLELRPDRVAMQDATAQMALLQYMVTERPTVAVPSSIHCDHLIQAKVGASPDLLRAVDENKEVYEFLLSASRKYGIDFWRPGSGIIHQVVLEQYAFPGAFIIGTDSHTPNAGGLGVIAIGVGGADAVDVMAGQKFGLLAPKIVGVHLKGSLSGWASAKDVILKVAGLLTVKGGTGKIIEYFGEGTQSISCTGKATITNMGAELGATTSIFPYDKRMAAYLRATQRSDVATLADSHLAELQPDPEVLANPKSYFDEVVEIDLSALQPQWVGPHTPDLLRPVSEMQQAVREQGYTEDISCALIGSCTNSSYEDISRAASLVRQAKAHNVKVKVPLLVTPGSDQVYKTIERDGFLADFLAVGATVLANACGPCIGQWDRSDIKRGQKNSIVTSYNRNFRKRNDGNTETEAFIGSPELVTALAFAGKLSFNPVEDSVATADGGSFRFSEPHGAELPPQGYVFSRQGLESPPSSLEERCALKVLIDPKSDRLAPLEQFPAWQGSDFLKLPVLLKAQGKCTTDHISQAGPWLKYRGHLPNISRNMFLGAINAFTGEAGKGLNLLSGERGISFPEIGQYYRDKHQGWVVIGDENYGEGSSREHAAMSPRYFGCKAVIVKSFARIHETNLIKQGVLPLTFVENAAYDAVQEQDRISILGLASLQPGSRLTLRLDHSDGSSQEFALKHALTSEQVGWFRAGSALNTLRP
jgi:aconitate hydratase